MSLHGQIEPWKQVRFDQGLYLESRCTKFGLFSKNLNFFRKQSQVNSINQLELVTQYVN